MKALLVISEDGYGRCIPLDDLPVKPRGGQGSPIQSTAAPAAAALVVDGADDVVVATALGKVVWIAAAAVPIQRRGKNSRDRARGSRLVRLAEGDSVASAALVPPTPDVLSGTPKPGVGGQAATETGRSLPEGSRARAGASWPHGRVGLLEGESVGSWISRSSSSSTSPDGKPAVPRDEWAQTDVHKASSYSCAHCGLQYELPDQVYACIDDHAAAVADRALAA